MHTVHLLRPSGLLISGIQRCFEAQPEDHEHLNQTDCIRHRPFPALQGNLSGADCESSQCASIATGIISAFPPADKKPSSEQSFARSVPPQLTILMMIGGALGDDAIKPDDLVTEVGKPMLQAAREGCNAELAQVVRSNDLTLANSLKDPEIADRLNAVIDMSPVRMPVPVFLATGLADKSIYPQRQYAAVAALCAAGSHVVWKAYAGVSHNGTVHAAYPDELAFVQAALAGNPMQSNCAAIADPGLPGDPLPGFKFND
jgi:hypothetical protein